jgi:uncharacterized membrane protein
MELNNLFGLPAHPLIVHAAVVLLPLAAVATVAVAAVPKARRHYAPMVFVVALLAAIAVGLAQQSGESLVERVPRTELVQQHAHQAEIVLPWAIAVAALAAVITATDVAARREPRLASRVLSIVLVCVALVAATGALWSIVDVGHSGAKATWHEVPEGEG